MHENRTRQARSWQPQSGAPAFHAVLATGGGSTIEQQTLEEFVRQSVSGDVAPIWMREFEGEVKTVWFNVLPVGWVREWRPSPALQWVVPSLGRWFIETQDGKRIEMGPGEIHWGEDLPVEGAGDSSPIAPDSSASCPACR